MSFDTVPSIEQFRPAVLRVLNSGNVLTLREIFSAVADETGLSDKLRAETIPSGQPRHHNRIAWACSGLYQAGLLERPKRGSYRITANGLIVDARNLREYTDKHIAEWLAWQEYQAEVATRKNHTHSPASHIDDSLADVEAKDPIDVMAEAERDFNAQTETELRKRLQESSPEFFERAVIDLLWAMGYGGAHGEKRHVGKSNDGGIDGIIRQDALGLSNIYIQAKRYADTNKVGDTEIRNFIGSLASKGAELGVFITTSDFLPAARRSVENNRHGKIVLINGIKLTSLMLSYGVAVNKSREFTLYEIDDDFFEDSLI